MSESTYHDAIMDVLADKADHGKILEQLSNDSEMISAYNRHVLDLLRMKDIPVPVSCRLEPLLESMPHYHEEPYIEDVGHDMQMTREFLNEFYKIDNCPSFLYHDAMLAKEDLDFLLDIYSHAYGLRQSSSEDCGRFMQESLLKYAKAILQACRGKSSEQSIRDALE